MRKQTHGMIILIILLIAEIGLSYLFVHDLAWIFGVISPELILTLTVVSTIASFGITLLFIIYRTVRKKRVLFGFKEFSDMRAPMISILLISLLLFSFISYPTIDMNDAYQIERNNAEALWVNDSTTLDYIIHMFFVENATSASGNYIGFWYNSSILSNVTRVMFVYYNGTHSQEGEYNKTFPITEYPDTGWWTGYTWFYSDNFGNGSIRDAEYYRGYTIPAQSANTTVLYRLAFRMENATGFYYTTYFERNYTVLFSPAENAFNTDFTQTIHFYSGVIGLALLTNIGLTRSFYAQDVDNSDRKRKAERQGILTKRVDDESYPTVRELISISEKLETTMNKLRIMSSVLMTLSISTLVGITSSTTTFEFLDITLATLVFTILLCLGCLVISLGRIAIKDSIYSLTESMIPSVDSVEEFRFLVYLKILKQEEKIDWMNQLLQAGIVSISVGVIIDIVMLLLLPWVILYSSPITSIVLVVSLILVTIAGCLYVLAMAKSIGYFHGVMELKENPD